MIGFFTLIIFLGGLVFSWFVIKYIGHLLGFFENPMQQKVVSGIKLKKKEVKEEVEEEVEEKVEEEEEEKEEKGFFYYVFVFVVIGVLLYWLFDVNIFELLAEMIAGGIEGFNKS